MNILMRFMMTTPYSTITFAEKFVCQYEHIKIPAAPLSILYIHGLSSNPWGKKPESVKALAQQLGLNFFRFELAGHGIDSHNYDDTCLDVWKHQILDIIENQIKGDVILVGHCIGGWAALLAAIDCPEKVKGLVCSSTSPNLYKLLMSQATPEQKLELETNGKITVGIERMSFTFTQKFMDCAAANALTEREVIPVSCPVHLLQGMQDTFINWRIVLKLAAKLATSDVTTKLLKNTNHHIQKPADLQEINRSITEIVRTVLPQLVF